MNRRLPDIPTPPHRRSSNARWDACYAGDQPAEMLSQPAREKLITLLWELGWADWQIAEHTAETNYTVARIRGRLGLTANTEGAA